MTKVLQLAKPYTPAKLSKRVLVSEKLDGVPIRFDVHKTAAGDVAVKPPRTRQDEHCKSVEFISKKLAYIVSVGPFLPGDYSFVGEVTHEDYKDFKDVSGVVRRQEPQTGLILNLFDFHREGNDTGFDGRQYILNLLIPVSHTIRVVKQTAIMVDEIDAWMEANLPDGAEGGVIRSEDDLWAPGKRTWGYQKYLKKPTIDLWITGCEEAKGSHAGSAGRLLASYKGGTIGVGPGKLTHDERKQVLSYFSTPGATKRMAKIQYKEDASYVALREPTFQHWHDGKSEADA